MPDKVAYIWEVVTKKEFMGRGIAKKLLKYGFKELCEFEQNNNNEMKKQIIFFNKL